jgi:hypothetical protein
MAVLTAGMLFLALANPAVADDVIVSDRRIPKNAVLHVSIRNISALKAEWPKTLLAQMFADESLARFREQLTKKFDEWAQELQGDLGMSPAEVWDALDGEVAFSMFPLSGNRLTAVAFINFGEHSETVHKLLEKFEEFARKEEKTRREEEYEDTRLVFFEKPLAEDESKMDTDAYFIKDTFIVIGEDADAFKEVLKRWDGKHESTFADNESFQYILEKCRTEGSDATSDVVWYANPVALFKALAAEHGDKLGAAEPVLNLLPMLGLDNFKGVGGAIDLMKGDFETLLKVFVLVEQTPQGINNLLQFDLTAQAPPKWLSSEWTAFSSFNWNPGKTYGAIEGLADMFLGPGGLATKIQEVADNPATGGIHLKKDVFDQLGGAIHIAERESGDGGKTAEGTLVALQIKKAAAIRSLLGKVANLGLVKIKEREFQGETIYEFSPPSLAGGLDDTEEAVWGLAVSEGHLMIATDVRLLERVLRGIGDGETLADSALYKRVARRFPARTAYINFIRRDVSLKSFFELLKASTAQFSETFGEFDFSVLPDADVLKKYLPPSGGYMEKDARGFRITLFDLHNESD